MDGPILIRRRDLAKPCLIVRAEDHGVEGRSPQPIATLVARSFGFTLLVAALLFTVSLFRHPASEGGGSNRSERGTPPKIAHLEQRRDAESVVVVYPSPKHDQKTPADGTNDGIHLPPVALSHETAVVLGKQIEMQAPDLASISPPDQSAFAGNLIVLPSPPPLEAAHTTMTDGPSSGAASADARAVIATLEKYSAAWNTKRVAQITELRPTLPRRTVQQELSSASSIVMHIRPTSVPRIEGNRATVECIHQVDQVFTDGVERQNPGIKMTYVLVRRGNNWLIDESR